MRWAEILFRQGFGSRRECLARIAAGCVSVDGRTVTDPQEEVQTEGLCFVVDGQAWPFHARALLLMHKPAGYECSARPRHHPSVLSLLPTPLRLRGVQPVGRLDEDTTGLLLLTDDGALSHRLTSPRRKVPKVYEAQTRHPVDDAQLRALLAGVRLRDDPRPAQALQALAVQERALRLTLAEGRYHQVRRMVAAVGNRVERLHRTAFAGLVLPQELAPGQWRWATPEEAHAVGVASGATSGAASGVAAAAAAAPVTPADALAGPDHDAAAAAGASTAPVRPGGSG